MATQEEIAKLQEGNIVRNASGQGYLVIRNDGHTVTAVRTVTVTNPTEWTVVRSSTTEQPSTAKSSSRSSNWIANDYR